MDTEQKQKQKPQTPSPNSSYLADNPHPRSSLVRLLRAGARMRRAGEHFTHAADEVEAARAELVAASELLLTPGAREAALRLAARLTARGLEAHLHAAVCAQEASLAVALPAAVSGSLGTQAGGSLAQQVLPAASEEAAGSGGGAKGEGGGA